MENVNHSKTQTLNAASAIPGLSSPTLHTGGLSVCENVFLHMVAPSVMHDPKPIPVAPVLSDAPVNIDNLTAEFSKMALHVTSGKALDMYQLSHTQSEQFKALYHVFHGPAVVSSPAGSNASKEVVTITNDGGFERCKFDVTKSKCFFCGKSWKETPEGNRHLRSDRCGLLQECIKKGLPISEDQRNLETCKMWRMKDRKSIYELLKEKVEAESVSMSTGKVGVGASTVLVALEFGSCAFHPVVLDESNVQYLDISDREFQLLTDVIGVLVGEAVTNKEAWDAWAEFGGLEEDGELPEVPCEMIGEVVATRRADAMANRMHEEGEDVSNKRMPPCAAEYPQPPAAKAIPVPLPRLGCIWGYVWTFLAFLF
ncbi:hypothetical protein HDU77_007162 [Chytriomyces hyalinus]|nr:hypothetical protein HDU77_007162 [Chytriomyces hyalinus]